MKSKAGRKGYKFEQEMEAYRRYFTTGTKKTQYRNAGKLKAYCEWANKTPEQLIQEYIVARKDVNSYNEWKRETRKKILEFYNYLKSKGHKINYCRTIPLGILAFYSANCERVPNVTREFDSVQIPEDEYVFEQETLRKAFYYSDLEGQTLLSLAVALGYSSIDFLELETQKLSQLVKETQDRNLDFIQFIGKSRAKTSVQPRSHLTPESIHSLKDYLPLLVKQHNGKLPKYLWCNGREDTHITNEGLNKKLKRILTKANIETYGKKVKFHCIRKFLYSRLQAKNRDIAKVITAKKVSASDITYIPDLDKECLRVFKETYKEIALNGDLTGKTRETQKQEIAKLEQALTQVEGENSAFKTRIDKLQQTTKELTDNLALLDEALAHHRNKEIQEIYQDIKQDLGLKIQQNTDMIVKLMKFVGYKETKTEQQ